MGAAFTPETLNQIKQKNISKPSNKNKNNNDNSNENIKKNKNNIYWNIFNNIYSPFYKKIKRNSNENENVLILNTKLEEENNINKNSINTGNEINDKILKGEKEIEEMNNIIFRKHKSFDLSDNFLNKDLLLEDTNDNINNNNNKINIYTSHNNGYNPEINSQKDNESNISDYADISKAYSLFNKKKIKKKIDDTKSKKIRDGYYNKLVITNQWNPLKKEKIFNNLFFFDWDDTLLCTSYLVPSGALNDMEVNKKDKPIISSLDSLASKLLSKSLKLGYVFIVTNGAPGWVELSSTKFYPETAKVLKKCKIISARGLCEKKLPGDMRQWKAKAFRYALDTITIKRNIPTNIIFFGDSIIEMDSSYNVKECFSNAYLKTIKFKENPSHTELEKELKIIFTQLDSILTNFKNLSIKVTRKKNE